MQNSFKKSPTTQFDEFRIIANAVGLLAFLTGLIYLRVLANEGMLIIDDGRFFLIKFFLFFFVIGGIAALLATRRWMGFGGITAVISGVGLITLFLIIGRSWMAAFFYGSPFIIAGILFLGCWYRSRQED